MTQLPSAPPFPPLSVPVGNLLNTAGLANEHEQFCDILKAPGLRVERIVSFGQSTPVDAPYIQNWDEWVLILSGAAGLEVDGVCRDLVAGDHVFIKAGQVHRVLYTQAPTIWLAVHIGEG